LDDIPWVQRAWTIQEIALAREVQVVYADYVLDYDNFMMNLSLCLTSLWYSTSPFTTSHEINEAHALILAKYKFRENVKICQTGSIQLWNASDVLEEVVFAKSSLAVDKVFAVHALLESLLLGHLWIPNTFHFMPLPDYCVDAATYYWEVITRLPQGRGFLYFLNFTDGCQWNERIPSWVPDFNNSANRQFPNARSWNKNVPEDSHYEVSKNKHLLYVKALLISTVQRKAELQKPSSKKPSLDSKGVNMESIYDYLATIQKLQAWIELAINTGIAPPYWRFFRILGELVFQRLSTEPDSSCIDYLFLLLVLKDPVTAVNAANLIFIKKSDVFLRQLLARIKGNTFQPLFDDDFLLMQEAMHKTQGITAFSTAEGYLGTGPLSLEEGDIIAKVGNANAPIILRLCPHDNHDNHYRVVGPAFIPEMVRKLGTRELHLTLEDIVLE
jgi:hypothetical protein